MATYGWALNGAAMGNIKHKNMIVRRVLYITAISGGEDSNSDIDTRIHCVFTQNCQKASKENEAA